MKQSFVVWALLVLAALICMQIKVFHAGIDGSNEVILLICCESESRGRSVTNEMPAFVIIAFSVIAISVNDSVN